MKSRVISISVTILNIRRFSVWPTVDESHSVSNFGLLRHPISIGVVERVALGRRCRSLSRRRPRCSRWRRRSIRFRGSPRRVLIVTSVMSVIRFIVVVTTAIIFRRRVRIVSECRPRVRRPIVSPLWVSPPLRGRVGVAFAESANIRRLVDVVVASLSGRRFLLGLLRRRQRRQRENHDKLHVYVIQAFIVAQGLRFFLLISPL